MNNKSKLVLLATIGNPNYFVNYILSDESIININIIDTAGQEKFRAMNESFYKKADCCMLIYDITNRKEFEEMKEYFIGTIKKLFKKNVKIILVGNKIDLENNRKISYNEGSKLAFSNNFLLIETSCLENKNVYEAFDKIIGIYRLSYINNEKNINEKYILGRNISFLLDLPYKKHINKLSNYLNQ